MLLASLALVVVTLAAAALAGTFRLWLRATAELDEARRRELRFRAWTNERARFLAARTAIAEATETTRAGHQAIAAIPFGILGAIPGARRGSKHVKGVHDGLADAVYDTIQRLSGEVSSRDADGSGPPGPSTPPADRPE